jgi:hypothetical protein
MKLLLLALGLLVLLAAIITFNVWHALSEPIVSTPTAYEIGRQHLHDQLEVAKKREAQFEQQDWNYITPLHNLILAHQQRIAKLTGNQEAAEIIAYDHQAIARIQARINELDAKERAQRLEKQQSTSPSDNTQQTPPHQP